MKVQCKRSFQFLNCFFVLFVLNIVCGSDAKQSFIQPFLSYLRNEFLDGLQIDGVDQWNTNSVLEAFATAQLNQQVNQLSPFGEMPEELIYITEQILKSKESIAPLLDIPLKVQQTYEVRPIDEIEYKNWPTNDSNYEYWINFMTGLSLVDEFYNADNCMYAVIGAWDKSIQWQNNKTEERGGFIAPDERRYLMPLMNLTGALAGDASGIPPYCWETVGIEMLDWWEALYSEMSFDFNTLLISFLFTQMGNAPKFKDAIDNIDENSNEGEQNYEIVFFQWGRIMNLVFFQIVILEERETLHSNACQSKSKFDCFIDSFKELQNYESYSNALETVSKMVPSDLFSSDNALSAGDKWSSAIKIASALGIAFVLDMHQKNVDLQPKFAINQLEMIQGLSIQSLVQYKMDLNSEYQSIYQEFSDIQNQYELEDFISEKTCKILRIPNSETNKEYVIDVLKPVINLYLTMNFLVPMVGDHNEMRLDTLDEGGNFLQGFKDGIVGVTGSDSKFYLCNSNISIVEDVYFWNYQTLLDQDLIDDNFSEENEDASTLELMSYIQLSMQWPFNTLYNCYWAGWEIYTPQVEQDQYKNPVLNKNAIDKTITYTVAQNVIYNILFNFGYQFSDVMWFIQLDDTEDEYYYRSGYVTGDLYMRFFYRTLTDVEVIY